VRPIVLIAINYIRTQWLALVIMTVYLLGIGGVFSLNQQRPEVLFFIRSQPLYLIFLALMLALPAIQADRKSKRIVAVLSKGIHRWQYLGGILVGCGLITMFFTFLIWATAYFLCLRGGYPTSGLALLSLALCSCGIAAGAAGLLYSTFLHPLLATAAATATLLLPLMMRNTGVHLPQSLFPVSWLVDVIVNYRFGTRAGLATITIAAAILTLVFWIAAAFTFARRDVTISPE
jgi:ABC-2 family transporter protein